MSDHPKCPICGDVMWVEGAQTENGGAIHRHPPSKTCKVSNMLFPPVQWAKFLLTKSVVVTTQTVVEVTHEPAPEPEATMDVDSGSTVGKPTLECAPPVQTDENLEPVETGPAPAPEVNPPPPMPPPPPPLAQPRVPGV